MAILTATKPGTDGLDQTWDFFIRNSGTEGMCSENTHYWDGESGVYYIQFPWPVDAAGHRAQDVSEGATQAWFWYPFGTVVQAPTPELDKDQEPNPTRAYLQVALPGSSGLVGEVRSTIRCLHFRADDQETNIEAGRQKASLAVAHNDDFVDTAKLIPDPVIRQRVASLGSPYRTVAKRSVVRVTMKSVMGVHKPPPGLASKGIMTHDRMSMDPIKAQWEADLARALGKTTGTATVHH